MVAPLFLLQSISAAFAGVVLWSDSPKQGEPVEITVSGIDPSGTIPGVKFGKEEYKLFPGTAAGVYKALIGIPADLDPGSYKICVGEDTKTVRVLEGKFPLQHLRLPPAKDNFNMAPGEEEAVEGAKSMLSSERQWHSDFVKPSKARMSTAFGVKRVVNGRMLKDYFHSGLDFAAAAGTPVLSCSDGTVVLAATGFKLHGNCVAVDHGQGVVSFYIHLKTIAVKVGQHVESGQKLGTVGQTGRANGPHLHFSIYVNKVATDPLYWFRHAYI